MKLKTNETAWQTEEYTVHDKKKQRILTEYVKLTCKGKPHVQNIHYNIGKVYRMYTVG
jgi:hypothetical protein